MVDKEEEWKEEEQVYDFIISSSSFLPSSWIRQDDIFSIYISTLDGLGASVHLLTTPSRSLGT